MTQPVAIVTGAASGIGLALTHNLLARGYKVAMADLNTTAGTRLSSELGPNTLFVKCDTSNYTQQAALFARAFYWGGQRLDFLAANAGIDDRQSLYDTNEKMPTMKMTVDGIEGEVDVPVELNLKTLDVDLNAVFQGVWLFKYFNRMSKGSKGGKVVVTSSAAGIYNIETNPQYGAAKHGLVGLVRSGAKTLYANDGITLNAVCPAFVKTGLCPPGMVDKMPKEHVTPMSTIMKAFDQFLDHDKMTGQTVECSLDHLYFRQMPEWANESQRWLGEGSDGFWEKAYKDYLPDGGKNGVVGH